MKTKAFESQEVPGYIAGDSAFALPSKLMKCYDGNNFLGRQKSLNHCVIRTRTVVEQAFGRLKGNLPVLVDNYVTDAGFASEVSCLDRLLITYCVCARSNCPFEET